MAYEFAPQLDEDDLDLIQAARKAIHGGRTQVLGYTTQVITGVDEHFGTPIATTASGLISGVVLVIEEEDRLLRLGGRVRVGDTKAVLLYEDAVALIGIDQLRRTTISHSPGSGFDSVDYEVDVLRVEGIGRPTRVELGLVRR